MRSMTKWCAAFLAMTMVGTATSDIHAENGVTDSKIILGQSCALKGPAAGLGQGMSTGLNVYFDKVNAAGGVNGRTIELKSLNDGYEPDRAEQTTKMLIENVKVFALIGEVGTPTSSVAVPIAEAAGVPFIGPFTGAEFLRNPYKPLVVNVRGSYYQEMERLAQYLVDEKGLDKIACFYQDDGYGRAGLSGINIALEKRGLKLVAEGTYKRNTTAINEGLSAIEGSQPQAVVMVGAYKPCAEFIKSAKTNANLKDAYFCNISFVGTKNLVSELGDAGDDKCLISQVVPYPWDESNGLVKEYTEAMKAAGKADDIGFISLEGYMVAKFFTEAMKKVDGEPTREKWLAAVSETGTFDLGGTVLEFGASDNQGMDKVFLSQVSGGKAIPLGSDSSVATAE